MDLTIQISEEEKALLRDRARAAGMTEEQYARSALKQQLSRADDAEGQHGTLRWVTERMLERFRHLPDEEPFDPPRPDGASQHDHYIYGTPKREDL